MNHPSRARMSRLTLGLLVALATAPAFAQSTSAGVGGQVVGADGQPVAGAEVTIVHTESGTVSRVVTDDSGRYNARGLRVGGPYSITINKAGAGTSSEEDVYLPLNQVTTVDAQLNNDLTTLQSVQVVGELLPEIFGADKMGTGTNVDREQIESLPSIQRNIQDYMRLDPRLAQTDKGRGEISAGGQNTRFNSIRIDGVSTNDPFGLEANNMPTLRQPVSMDAIEAINIDLANYDTTIAGGTGAVVDAVTKSGTNEFGGTAYYVFRDNDMVRDNEDGTPFGGFTDEETYGFTVGGPIVKDKLFFFANYEKFTRAAPGPAYGPVGSGASNIVDITPEQIAEAQQIARDVYGLDIGSFTVPGDLETNVEEYAVKLDWNINDYHRASLRYSKMEQVDANLPGIGNSSLSLNSYWYDHNKTFESTVVQLFSDWSMDFSTEFKLSTRDYSAIRDSLGDPMPNIGISLREFDPSAPGFDPDEPAGTPYLNFGTEEFTHINRVETEQLSAFGAGTWYMGDHAVKFGFDWEKNEIFNLFGRDLFGSYTFASLDHFRDGEYWEYSSRRPLPGQPFESIAADFSYENLGLFVQDDWMVTDNLTLMYGVRVDTPSIDESPRKNELIELVYGLDNTATIDGQELVQPRFGFNYTFDSERPTQLRGGIGLFQGAAANVWIGNSFQNAGFTPQIYGLELEDYSLAEREAIWAQYPFNPDPDAQPIVEGGQQMVVALMDPELEQPSVWKANLAFDHQLPWYGIVASAEALFTSVKTGLHYEILGLGAPTAMGPDGRLSYWCDPATASGGDRCNSGDAIAALRASGQLPAEFENITDWGGDNVVYLRPTNKGEGQQLTVSLSKPLTENWSWMFGYTYTQATEVNPLTSSQAHSNWDGRAILNPNTPTADTSNYEIRDRFTGAVTWRKAFFGDYNTQVSVFYEGRSGRPYSWTFQNDANGDSETNDLFYVPSGPGDVIFTGGAEMEAAFFDWLAAHPELSRFQGEVAPRNSSRSSFVNTFDVRILQELPGFWKGHKSEIWLDIMNIGNLINDDWGQISEIGFPFGRRVAELEGMQDGKYVYSFDPDDVFSERLYDTTGQSRWAVQVGFRYRF
ncbi:Oar protein [Lysobacter arseniciresistens ZS79]|uniref:Oar protein n=1 Tax=Lysobacter arseniciresistens ZS79 TaxID=913325 RepID=A0A0A0F256_9GAMM|nr:TonB-dependent receptor [Lysobacter arseniciresistens]KGM56854.1 Oar protein [Lysobacter arseniciresistens ZS79]